MEVQHQTCEEICSFQDLTWQPMSKAKQMPPRSTAHEFQIVPLTDKDGDRMVKFLRRFFFRDEPLNIEVGLLQSEDDRCEELEDYALSCIADGMSLMAVSPCGEMIGVCLNGVGEPGHLSEMEADATSCPHPRFRKILRLLAHIERHADVYNQFPDVDKVAEVRIVSVGDAWRGRGVATALIQSSRDLSQRRGYTLLRVDCTSRFTAKAAARVGMTCVYTLPYEEYKDENDRTVFRPVLPHTTVTTYVQRLYPHSETPSTVLARDGVCIPSMSRGVQSRQ